MSCKTDRDQSTDMVKMESRSTTDLRRNVESTKAPRGIMNPGLSRMSFAAVAVRTAVGGYAITQPCAEPR